MVPRKHVLRAVIAAGMLAAGLVPAVAAADTPAPDGRAQVAASTFVSRISGPDRYSTAASISAFLFDPGASRPSAVYVATGENYADAIAAGPAAANDRVPLLLVTKNSVPQATREALASLRPQEIRALGGTAAIADSVLAELGVYTDGIVYRYNGADRYETAVILMQDQFGPGEENANDTMWIAAGNDFADAMIAGGIASFWNDPMLLVPPDGPLPGSVASFLDALRPVDIIIVGSTAQVSPAIEAQLRGFAAERLIRIGDPDLYTRNVAAYDVYPVGPSSVSNAIITTGLNWPDGLGGTVLAGFPPRGPLFLVPGTCIPPVVAVRLFAEGIGYLSENPNDILYILGGPAAVSPAVEQGAIC
ncbi:MAG: cell wall-binding repeat-containing protein [Acidimicrobiales bacterium]|nr:cell wall-binding repeat-containing protein [Acidimicrobiales bacterium]